MIEAVKSGQADIGFVAYEATRLGTVEFSETYMLVQQSFLVPGDSPMRAVADVDQSGQKIAGTRNDSMALCLKRVLKQASLVELENNSDVLIKALTAREIDALGANRQRLTTLLRSVPGFRLAARQSVQRAAEYRGADGQAGGARRGQRIHRRCPRVGLAARSGRQGRRHRR